MDKDYILADHQVCHQKMTQAIDNLIRIEIYVVAAIGLFYAWYFVNASSFVEDDSLASRFPLWIPVAITVIGIIRIFMQMRYIATIGTYIRALEEKMFCDDEKLGWERQYPQIAPLLVTDFYRYSLWGALIITTIVVAVYMPL